MKNLKLTTKLYGVGAILVIVAVAVGLISIVGIHNTNDGLETVYNDRVVPLKQLKAIADDYAVAVIDAANKANAGIFTAEEALKGVEEASKRIRDNWKAYTSTHLTPEEMKLAGEAEQLFGSADAAVESLRKHLGGKTGSVKAEMTEFDGPLYQQIDPISGKITELVDLQLRVAKEEYDAAHSRFVAVLWISIGALIVGTLLGGIIGWVVIRGTTTTLQGVAERLSNGARQTGAAAHEVSGASHSLAEGASEQAASLEETSASLEEISAMTKRNADNASSSKTLSQQARDSAAAGLERISEMGRTLTTVKSAVGEMESAVSEMQSSSQEIAKIIKTIDEIAFQTNLLALNAAVEAARAGEAGAGFAVVADEVRSLAQRSAQAAKDTSEKIEAAVKRSTLGGVASKKVVSSLGEIEGSARNIEQVFNGIVTQVKSLDELIAEIASASKEQSQGVNEVNMAVGQMDKVTQSNAAHAEENASAAEELNAQVGSLQGIVSQLQAVISGGAAVADLPTQSAPIKALAAQTPSRSIKRKSSAPPVHAAPGFRNVPDNLDIPMPEPVGNSSGSFKDF